MRDCERDDGECDLRAGETLRVDDGRLGGVGGAELEPLRAVHREDEVVHGDEGDHAARVC